MIILFQDKMKEEIALIREMKPIIEREGSVVGLSIEDTVLGQYLLNEARVKAKKEGRAEGIEEGREEGKAQGRELGRREQKIETAVKLLQLNVSLEAIIEATGLTIEEIEKLRN
ncbi:hypothetical protein [Bacillus pinisoli]|uniref:hypothetical protein n=1 Tax=Bacillus pinisoli TaxID=2901866 RepID=UPI001FF2443C|nr:hypothetical protein [Bacillus pinisoli]